MQACPYPRQKVINSQRPVLACVCLLILATTASLLGFRCRRTTQHLQAVAHRDHVRTGQSTDVSEVQWQQAETAKARMPRDPAYLTLSSVQLQDHLPVNVLSMRRSLDRRAAMLEELRRAGMTKFRFIEAVDGMNDNIELSEVQRYIGGVRLAMWQRRQPYQLAKVAIDISHYRLLEDVMKTNRNTLIMEDDAEFNSEDFYIALLGRMRHIPQDWEVLYLYSCYNTVGGKVGAGVSVLRAGVCTLGYIATPQFAAKVLKAVKDNLVAGSADNVDQMYQMLIRAHGVQAYICEPALLNIKGGVQSTVDYDKKHHNVSEWEKQFVARRLW
eukprot:GHUV01004878.1.p1 GENE.GHUV01004878.1~~GHUV01004878.1.p1  ORF type:complete len:328 (+),score=37.26 GHUV01004878.1:228-1211(+)